MAAVLFAPIYLQSGIFMPMNLTDLMTSDQDASILVADNCFWLLAQISVISNQKSNLLVSQYVTEKVCKYDCQSDATSTTTPTNHMYSNLLSI